MGGPAPLILKSPPVTITRNLETKSPPKQEIKDVGMANDDVALATTLLVSLLDNPSSTRTRTSSNTQPPSDWQDDGLAEATACAERRGADSHNEEAGPIPEAGASGQTAYYNIADEAEQDREAGQQPEQQKPKSDISVISAEIQEDINWFLEQATLFAPKDFDGRVRQHMHAIRTLSGREGVQEACVRVRDSVCGMRRREVSKPSAYLLTLFKRHL